MKKQLNQCVLVTPKQKRTAIHMLRERGMHLPERADNVEIAQAIAMVTNEPLPTLPEGMGRMVLAFVAGSLQRSTQGLPEFRPYVPPKLPESQQRRMDEFRAIPSLYS